MRSMTDFTSSYSVGRTSSSLDMVSESMQKMGHS